MLLHCLPSLADKKKLSTYRSSWMIINDLQTIMSIVLKGFGIAYLPSRLIKTQLQQRILVETLPEYLA